MNGVFGQFETMSFEYEGEAFCFRVSPHCEVYRIYSENKENAIRAILNADQNKIERLFSIHNIVAASLNKEIEDQYLIIWVYCFQAPQHNIS